MSILFIIIIIITIIDKTIELSLSSLFQEYNVSKSIIYYPSSKDYSNSVRLANQRCEKYCPDVVVKPNSVSDITNIMRMVYMSIVNHNTSINISVKAGGHSYTCQSMKNDGILIDMQNFDNIHVSGNVVNVGAGLTFEKVFKVLNKNDRTIIHGQCLQVGVVGYTIHGGVHFGSLSNVYGLGSDNVVGVSMVLYNGSVVDIYTNNDNSIECLVDNVIGDNEECNLLMRGMKGAGSSFGIVTSLDLRLLKSSHLRTALTIITIDTNDFVNADKLFQSYLSKFPADFSLTFFGLDEYFKAYFFVMKFSKNKFSAIGNKPNNLFKKYKETSIHFIVEVSWVDNNEIPSYDLHPLLKELNEDVLFSQSKLLEMRPWFVSTEPWSVPSYSLVWGQAHYFSGASITVDKEYSSNVLKPVFSSFRDLKIKKDCSDCVIVIHKVGEGLKQANSGSSFNSFIQKAHLWIEVDCGHFFRRQLIQRDWPKCSNFVDNLQNEMDLSTVDESRMHYPNVPNLETENWPFQYYGKDNYQTLQHTKSLWDPVNIFNHAQSIQPLTFESDHEKLIVHKEKSTCQNIYFNYGLEEYKRTAKLVLGLSGFALLINKVSSFVSKMLHTNK